MTSAGCKILAATVMTLGTVAAAMVPAVAHAQNMQQAPANFRTTTVSYTWVALAWDATTGGPSSYVVSIGSPTGPQQAYTGATSQSFGGLDAGVTYQAFVRAIDTAGNESAAATITFTTQPRTMPPPAAPANLRAVSLAGSLHSIVWDAPAYPLGLTYTLEVGGSVLASTANTSFTISHLIHNECAVEPGGTYTFTVRAWAPENYPSALSGPLTVIVPS